jgi:hypothetical protein
VRAIFLLLALGGILAAARLDASEGERFRYRLRPGQVTESRIHLASAALTGPTTSELMRTQLRVTMAQRQEVRAVQGDVATLVVVERPTSGSLTAFGRTEPYARDPIRSVVRLSDRGRFLSRQTVGEEPPGPDGLDALDALYGLAFPPHPIRPGDSWDDRFRVGSGAATREVRVTGRYVGRERFRGRYCARFVRRLTAPLPPTGVPGTAPRGQVIATAETYFDPSAGEEVYSSTEVTVVLRAALDIIEEAEFVNVVRMNIIQVASSLTASGTGARPTAAPPASGSGKKK